MRGLGVVLSLLAVLGFPGAVSVSDAAAPAPSEPDELLVRFSPAAAPPVRSAAISELDARVVERLPLGLVRLELDAGTSVAAAEAAAERQPGVLYAQPNHRYRFFATPNDASFGSLWGLHQASDADIDAPEAWDLTTGSESMTVAVADSGIAYTHPDLVDNMWSNPGEIGGNGTDDDGNGKIDDVRGWDFADNDAVPLDAGAGGHGTHIAGTIGARGNNATGVTGVNWRVKLMALRIGGASITDDAIVQAFRYACAEGAKVVNGSFGGGAYSQAITDAIASCPNTLFVFAAGNAADDNDLFPMYPCNDPGPNVLCVAATDQSDSLAWFSNFGAGSVDLAAPGVDVYSTIPPSTYDFFDGTSMASPHVAGAAALVWAHRPALTVGQIRRTLILSADRKPALDGRVVADGRLNVFRALSQDVIEPVGLSAASASHSPGVWSNNATVTLNWGGASDESGVDGHSFAFSSNPSSVADEVKDAEENLSALTSTLADGIHWFLVRAVDGAGNWGETARVGPLLIDTFPAIRPVVSSPSHRVGAGSADRTVDVAWTGATDSMSGLDGYSIAWNRGRAPQVDLTKDAEETTLRTTSARLAAGSWWFGIRVRDNAGTWSDAVTLGPFVIRTTPAACAVPRLRGLALRGAKRQLVRRGCALGRVTRAYSRRVGRGRVIAQRPRPGLRLRRGARVSVVLSRGRRR